MCGPAIRGDEVTPWLWSSLDQEFARWNCSEHQFFAVLDTDAGPSVYADYIGQFAYLAAARASCISEASRRSERTSDHETLASLTTAASRRAERWAKEAASIVDQRPPERPNTQVCSFAWSEQAVLELLQGSWEQLLINSYTTAAISAVATRALIARLPHAAGLMRRCDEPPEAHPFKALIDDVLDPYEPVNLAAAILSLRGFWKMLNQLTELE